MKKEKVNVFDWRENKSFAWVPVGKPVLKLTEGSKERLQEMKITDRPCVLDFELEEPFDKSIISKVTAYSDTNREGGRSFLISSFLLKDSSGKTLASINKGDEGKPVVLINDGKVTLREIALAVEGVRNALGGRWYDSSDKTRGYIIAGLFRPKKQKEIEELNYGEIIYDERGEMIKTVDGSIWVIDAFVRRVETFDFNRAAKDIPVPPLKKPTYPKK